MEPSKTFRRWALECDNGSSGSPAVPVLDSLSGWLASGSSGWSEMAGSSGASRAAGSAMKKEVAANYPCWRVVGADGSLHESAIGDPEEQRKRLEAEGVEFSDAETVDLDASGYEE